MGPEVQAFSLARFFAEGGAVMYLLLVLLLPTLGFATLHAVFARRWTQWTAGGLVALVLVVGLGGMMLGRSRTDAAIASVDPTMAEALRREGYRESSRPAELGLVLAVLASVPLFIGVVRRKPEDDYS